MEKGRFYLNVRLCTSLFSKAVSGGRYALFLIYGSRKSQKLWTESNHGQQHFVSLHRKSGGAGHLVCWFLVLSMLTIEGKGSYQIFNINDELNYFLFETDNVIMIKWKFWNTLNTTTGLNSWLQAKILWLFFTLRTVN